MISVCIATYNGEKYITEQLQSILMQLAPQDEVIVSDDGSTDGTLDCIATIADARVHIIRHAHIGGTQSFYRALDKAQGEIIFLADQDDVWLPGKVRRCMEKLKDYDLVVSDAQVTDASLKPMGATLFQLVGSREGLWKNWIVCTFYGSTMAFKRTILDAAKPFPQAKYIAHDWWIGIVAQMTGRVCFMPEPLILYRRHETTVTQLHKGGLLTRSPRPLYVKIAARLQMAYHIIRYLITH